MVSIHTPRNTLVFRPLIEDSFWTSFEDHSTSKKEWQKPKWRWFPLLFEFWSRRISSFWSPNVSKLSRLCCCRWEYLYDLEKWSIFVCFFGEMFLTWRAKSGPNYGFLIFDWKHFEIWFSGMLIFHCQSFFWCFGTSLKNFSMFLRFASFSFAKLSALGHISQFPLRMSPAELMLGKWVFVGSVIIGNADFSFADVFNIAFASRSAQRKDGIKVFGSCSHPGEFSLFFFLDFPARLVVMSSRLI